MDSHVLPQMLEGLYITWLSSVTPQHLNNGHNNSSVGPVCTEHTSMNWLLQKFFPLVHDTSRIVRLGVGCLSCFNAWFYQSFHHGSTSWGVVSQHPTWSTPTRGWAALTQTDVLMAEQKRQRPAHQPTGASDVPLPYPLPALLGV